MCMTTKNLSLQGDFYSEIFSYFTIRLQKCIEDGCQPPDVVDAYFNTLQFNVAFVNNYFDYTDYNEPIKSYIDDSLFFDLESARIKNANFYVMKAEVNLQDDFFQLG